MINMISEHGEHKVITDIELAFVTVRIHGT